MRVLYAPHLFIAKFKERSKQPTEDTIDELTLGRHAPTATTVEARVGIIAIGVIAIGARALATLS